MATFHLLALGAGLGAVWVRAGALRAAATDGASVGRALRADAVWGIAALIWISTGLLRAFGGLEKGSGYYLQNHVFWAKMGMLLAVLLLELWPMVSLIRWRIALAAGRRPDTRRSGAFAIISMIQAALVTAMVFAATAMARGYGSGSLAR